MRFVLLLLFLLSLTVLWGFLENGALQCNGFTIASSSLPEGFDGFRIVHVSDLHNTEFGEGNEKLLQMLREADPDIIAITGDLIDSRRPDLAVALAFAEEAAAIAPCYYVTGNHESRLELYTPLEAGLKELGITVLRNDSIPLERNGEAIRITGVDDPSFGSDMAFTLSSLASGEFTVLLSHRPELFDLYCENGMDVVLTGHAHGGQFRLPFLGGLIAPNQGLFPRYDSGLYTDGGTNMLVSRGLGNSLFPFRLNNPPEILLITLKTA